ncbi:MAG: CsbD family protein [Deltaproteobacteria bacterium]|nr:CsbD family protein [Deltaproteobacteria bacterium]
MNADTFKGQWKQLKGKAKQQWGKLTDDDLKQVEGNYDRFVGTIQERYGEERDAAQKKVDKWLDESGDRPRA